MEEVLLALAVMTTAALLTVAGSLLGALWYLRRRNRVHPRHRSAAPLSWLASPLPAARAHRQLRAAVRLTSAGLSPALGEQADLLGRHAVGLDAELVHAARLPRHHRRQRVRALQGQVVVVERTAVQLVDLSRRPATPSPAPPEEELARLAERVGLVAAARDELAALSASSLPGVRT
jgi:hypothetical protein